MNKLALTGTHLTSMNQTDFNLNVTISSASELSIFENVCLIIFLVLLDLLTVVGNSLTILAILFDYHLRSPTHFLMGSLAMADLLIGTAVLPYSSYQLYFNSWPFGSVLCTIWKTVDVLCCTASIYLLLAISVDRYVGVTRPLSYSSILTKKRVYMMIAGVWMLSLVVSLVGIGWKSPPATTGLCEVNKDILYSFFSASLSFYIPLVLICIIYYRIYTEARIQMNFLKTGTKTSKTDGNGNSVTLRVHRGPSSNRNRNCTCAKLNTMKHKSFNTIEESESFSNSPKFGKLDSLSELEELQPGTDKTKKPNAAKPIRCPHCSGTESTGNNSNLFNMAFSSKLAKFKREKKAAKNLAIVVGCLVLCWMPFFIILPIEALIRPYSNVVLDKLVPIFFWLGYCNSAMNPLIYAYSSREFRRAYKGLIQCNIRQLNKKENLEKLSRLNYQSNRPNNKKKANYHLNNIYEENSLISNDRSV